MLYPVIPLGIACFITFLLYHLLASPFFSHFLINHQSHTSVFFFFNDPPPPEIYTLSLHDALPILRAVPLRMVAVAVGMLRIVLPLLDVRRVHVIEPPAPIVPGDEDGRLRPQSAPHDGVDLIDRPLHAARYVADRSEEHTSELQSPCNLVCRLLLEKKKKHAIVYYSSLLSASVF